jgi:hypothetical protein
MGYLLPATTKKGGDFKRLVEVYDVVLEQRLLWIMQVSKLVGGFIENRTLAGRAESQFYAVPRETQSQAVRFIMSNLRTPSAFLNKSVISQITPNEGIEKVQDNQRIILYTLLNPAKYRLLSDQSAMSNDPYLVSNLLTDVSDGLWEELDNESVRISPDRRDLQRLYLSLIGDQMRGVEDSSIQILMAIMGLPFDDRPDVTLTVSSDFRPAARVSLLSLSGRIEAAMPDASDEATRAHLLQSLKQIEDILENKPSSN